MVTELKLGSNFYFWLSETPSGSYELAVLDSRFLDPDFTRDRAKSVILDQLTLDDLKKLHKWLDDHCKANQYKLP